MPPQTYRAPMSPAAVPHPSAELSRVPCRTTQPIRCPPAKCWENPFGYGALRRGDSQEEYPPWIPPRPEARPLTVPPPKCWAESFQVRRGFTGRVATQPRRPRRLGPPTSPPVLHRDQCSYPGPRVARRSQEGGLPRNAGQENPPGYTAAPIASPKRHTRPSRPRAPKRSHGGDLPRNDGEESVRLKRGVVTHSANK